MTTLPVNDRLTGPLIASAGQVTFDADFPLIDQPAADAGSSVVFRRDRDGVLTELGLEAFDVEGVTEAAFTVRLDAPALEGDRCFIIGRQVQARGRAHPLGGAVRTETLEDDAREAAARDQEARRDIDRALLFPPGEAGQEMPRAAARSGRFLAFDEDGILDLSWTYDGLSTAIIGDIWAPISAAIASARSEAVAAINDLGATVAGSIEADVDQVAADRVQTGLDRGVTTEARDSVLAAIAASGGLPGGIRVDTRTALAAFVPASLSDGQQAYLQEAGREGLFQWSSANNSALVTADPLQGITVAPASATSGASGAWNRVIIRNTYLAAWWGTSPERLDNQVCYNAAGVAMPDASYLYIPDYTHTANAPIQFRPDKEVHIRGVDPTKSLIKAALLTDVPSVAHFDLMQLCGSKSTAKDFSLSGSLADVGSGEPVALTLGKSFYAPGGVKFPGDVYNMVADNVTILDGSAGILVTFYFHVNAGAPASGFRVHNRSHYSANYNPVVRNCLIRARKAGILHYGCVNDRSYNNDITLNALGLGASFTAGLRILGGQGTRVDNTTIRYLVEEDKGTAVRYGLFVAAAGFNGGDYGPPNENIVVNNIRTINANRHLYLGTAATGGSLVIDGAVCEGPMDSTKFVYIIADDNSIHPNQWKKLTVRNVTARGGSHLMLVENCISHAIYENIEWTSNASTTDFSSALIYIRDYGTLTPRFGIIELRNIRMVTRRPTYGEIYFIGMAATTKIFAKDVWSCPDGGPGFAQFLPQSCAAGSKFISDGVTQQDMSTPPLAVGLNYRYPTGAWVSANV